MIVHDMRTRVAMAIAERDTQGLTWMDYLRDADAAMIAMLEPTEDMLAAITPLTKRTGVLPVAAAWRAMIIAALGLPADTSDHGQPSSETDTPLAG